jgi:hypothetical protein
MQLDDFQRMVERMLGEVPRDFLEGIVGLEVSSRTVPHPEREGVYTMGECVPLETGGDSAPSRIVLYHGSFRALSREQPDFDWRAEAWDTLTHELRHHLEWKARSQELEEYDWAAEQSFARSDEDAFDPLFFLAGERIAPDTYQIDDDVFIDRVVRELPATAEVAWQGRRYRVPVPRERLPLYLALRGVADGPPGDLVLVLRRAGHFLDLFRGTPRPVEREANVEPAD